MDTHDALPPQDFIDDSVEQILTENYSSIGRHHRPSWRLPPSTHIGMVVYSPRGGQISYSVKEDVNRHWLELAYLQKRHAGRRYFGAPPDTLFTDLGGGTMDRIHSYRDQLKLPGVMGLSE